MSCIKNEYRSEDAVFNILATSTYHTAAQIDTTANEHILQASCI